MSKFMVDIAVPELAVTSLPGLLACRPWQRLLAASENWITLTAEGRHPDFQETRTSPCLTATILVDFRSFFLKISYCLGIFTKL